MAVDGKPIMALPSTAKNGTVSRIVAQLSPGAGVVTTRGDVHYIATEYGVAYVHGKSLRERVLALIAIAHPKFREGLMAKAKESKYLFEDEVIPQGAVYPVEVEHEREVGGVRLFVRPVKPSDERLMQEYLYDLSERSVYLRFFENLKAFHRELAQEMVAVDYRERFGVIATIGSAEAERIVAAAHWILDVDENLAEVAFSVADEYQGRGIGRYMSQALVRLARERGIKGFRASVLSENVRMRRIFDRQASENDSRLYTTYDSGIFAVWFHLSVGTDESTEGVYISPPAWD